MEVQAVLEGLQVVDGSVNVVSDSTYVVKCFNDRWYEGWKKRGWKNSQKKPVANRDLWEPLIELYLTRQNELTFTWVKGHSGNKFNEIADDLAVAARDESMAGVRSTAGSAVDETPVPWPIGRAVWVVGPATLSADTTAMLTSKIAAMDPDRDIVVSGLRRGAELLAGELALQNRIALAAVLPFANPAAAWPTELRDRFDACADGAEWLVVLAGDATNPGKAVESRNQWLRDAAVGAIVVEDDVLHLELEEHGLAVIQVAAG